MKKGLNKLYSGDFNTLEQENLPDGSIVITLTKDNEDEAYRFRVRDLYGKNEEVLEEEVISREVGIPPWIKQRMKEAKEWREAKDAKQKPKK